MTQTKPKKLTELAVKCLFLERLRADKVACRTSTITSEYVLGATGRRIDLAIWNGEFIGVEVKSKFDSLHRLSPQLDVYLQCFDKVVLVVDEKHLAKAAALLPDQVEFWSVDALGQLSLVRERVAPNTPSANSLLRLCSVSQLRKMTASKPKERASRAQLMRIAEHLPYEDIRAAAIDVFKNSFDETSSAFWKSVEGRDIGELHLTRLSRFAATRKRFQREQQKRANFWKSWVQLADYHFANAAAD